MRWQLALLGVVLVTLLVAGCTSQTTVRDEDSGNNDDEQVSAGGSATPGFESLAAVAAVGGVAALFALRRKP